MSKRIWRIPMTSQRLQHLKFLPLRIRIPLLRHEISSSNPRHHSSHNSNKKAVINNLLKQAFRWNKIRRHLVNSRISQVFFVLNSNGGERKREEIIMQYITRSGWKHKIIFLRLKSFIIWIRNKKIGIINEGEVDLVICLYCKQILNYKWIRVLASIHPSKQHLTYSYSIG